MKSTIHAVCWAAFWACGIGSNSAANFQLHNDGPSFQAVVGGAPLLTQNFDPPSNLTIALVGNQALLRWQGLATLEETQDPGGAWNRSANQSNSQLVTTRATMFYRLARDLRGTPVLPGVFLTSPFQNLQVFEPAGAAVLFGFDDVTRHRGLGFYEIHLMTDYNAVAFDVAFWDPGAPGPALVEVLFSDGVIVFLKRNQTSGHEDIPVFFGITSDKFIKRVRWNETPEVDRTGNEEVALDNLAVALIP